MVTIHSVEPGAQYQIECTRKWNLSRQEQELVDRHWEKIQRQNPNLFRGTAYGLSRVTRNRRTSPQQMTLHVWETDMAHVWSRGIHEGSVQIPQFIVPYMPVILETSDGYYVLGLKSSDWSPHGEEFVETVGGTLDQEDLRQADPIHHNVTKELREELGHGSSHFLSLQPIYEVWTPRGLRLVYRGILNMPKAEHQAYFYDEFMKEAPEIEIYPFYLPMHEKGIAQLDHRRTVPGLAEILRWDCKNRAN